MAAKLVGINLNRIYMLTLVSGRFWSIAGVDPARLLCLSFRRVYFVLTAFVVVVLGGIIWSAPLGDHHWITDSLSGYYIDPSERGTLSFSVVLLIPSGLMGIVGAEEMGMK
jgi:branched-subunit amino acid ABC-type transport system permease component